MFDFFKKKRDDTKKIISNEKDSKDSSNRDDENFALYLLFSKVPQFNSVEIEKRIKKVTSDNVEIKNILENDDTTNAFGSAVIGKHKFKIVGLEAPLPEEISEYTVGCAYGNKDELLAMNKHTYHIIAFYEGESTDYNEMYNAFAELAYGFLNDNFVGLANGYAWNAITPSVIKGLFEDERMADFNKTPAMMIWRNFVKIKKDDKIWFVTKGNNIYGAHEYAFKGDSFKDSQMVYDMFEDIFYYEYEEKPVIEAGHTLQIGDEIFIKFRHVYEAEDDLNGDGIGTLVIEFINEDEINK